VRKVLSGLLLRAQKRRNNVGSYARFPLAEVLKSVDLDRLNEWKTIDPRPLPPRRPDAFTKIQSDRDSEGVGKTARSTSSV
jgi:hypothetical protein